MSDFVLHELQGCPHYTKAKDRLSDLNLEYESRMVPSAHAKCEEVEEINDQTGAPILVDEEHGVERVSESNDIVDYLERIYDSAA